VPSARVGDGLGDLGYVEKVMAENEWIKEFWLPILTQTGPNEVTIYPWLCRRGEPLSVYLAEEIWVCDVSEFPVRRFNPAWERAVTASAQRETDVPGTTLKEDPVADPADFEGRNGSQTTEVVLPVGEFRFDPEAFKTLVDGTLVGWEQDRTGQQLLRVDHPEGVRLLITLDGSFPGTPPLVIVHDGQDFDRVKPVPWSHSDAGRPEQRLAGLCNWIAAGFHRKY